MERLLLSAACALFVLTAGPAPAAESGARAKPAQDRAAPDRVSGKAPPVIGCPSLANYRMLVRGGPAAAAAVLADPKADHLGCAALARGRITGIADHVVLGGQAYDCAVVQGTTACHWVEARSK